MGYKRDVQAAGLTNVTTSKSKGMTLGVTPSGFILESIREAMHRIPPDSVSVFVWMESAESVTRKACFSNNHARGLNLSIARAIRGSSFDVWEGGVNTAVAV